MHFLKLIRPANLLIVAIIQSLLQYKILVPALSQVDKSPLLDVGHFVLFVLSTLLIAASGYVINDLFDIHTDSVNKSEKQIIGKHISERSGWIFYWILIALGFLISLKIALHIDELPLLLIYPAACFLLYLYSKSWKSQGLIGNIVVAVFSAFVTGILLFAERKTIMDLEDSYPEMYSFVIGIFVAYMVFSFLTSLFRELIKDIEDIEGDTSAGHNTLPISIGKDRAVVVALFYAAMTFLSVVCWIYLQYDEKGLWMTIYLFFAIAIPLLFIMVKTTKANSSSDFHQISTYTKLIMLAGIIYLAGL